MMFQFSFPTEAQLESLKADQKDKPFSYPLDKDKRAAYTYDNHAVLLGEGEATFEAAQQAIRQWAMFPNMWTSPWAFIHSSTTPLEVGRVVIMSARIMGVWWLNAARIVYIVQEKKRFGFAYGTLPHHAESGEELFQVRMDDNGRVWYEIQAFSHPRHWMARLAFPVARHYQLKFVKHSQKHFKEVTNDILAHSKAVV
jgi:uncharacterized protein (UPF0548 family)